MDSTHTCTPPKRGFALLDKPYAHILLISLLGLLAYSNTFDVPFQWDEEGFIFPVAGDLNYFTDPAKARWFEFYNFFISRYAGYLTFALNYEIHGLSVQGYHIFNMSIHLLNAMLVYFLVRLTFKTPVMKDTMASASANNISLIAALLFVSHPVQTEAVTYIYQRFASLVALFYLLSLVFYIRWRLSPSPSPLPQGEGIKGRVIFYALSLLSAVLAMKTKENALALPVVIALYEVFFFSGSLKKRIPSLLPFFLIALIIPITLIDAGIPLGEAFSRAARSNSMLSRQDYLLTQFRVIVTYIRFLILPVNQNLDYDYPAFHSLFNAQVFLSLTLLLSVFLLGIYSCRKKELKVASFGIFWFFITLSVESSIIPIADLCVEHRLYLPSIGFSTAISFGIVYLLKKTDSKAMKVAAASFLTFAVITLAFSTYWRNTVWESKITLWEDAAQKSPLKARPHSNLGLAYRSAGLTDKATAQFNIALKLDPANASAHNNLGSIYHEKGLLDEALEHYSEAVSLQPDLVESHYNLGIIYSAMGNAVEAVEHYESALWYRPNMASAHYNLGVLFGERGLLDKAIEHYESALSIKPDFKTHVNLGNAYKSAGRIDEAITHQQMALALNPGCAEAYYNMGNAYRIKRQTDKAINSYLSAISIRPDYESAHLNPGAAYLEENMYDKAVKEFETALSINPRNANARELLINAKSGKK